MSSSDYFRIYNKKKIVQMQTNIFERLEVRELFEKTDFNEQNKETWKKIKRSDCTIFRFNSFNIR